MKNFILFLLLICQISLFAQNPLTKITGTLNEYNKKISKTEAAEYITKLKKEGVLSKLGEETFRGYLLEDKPLSIFQEFEADSATLQKLERLKMFGGMLKANDSLLINKTGILLFLGLIESQRTSEGIEYGIGRKQANTKLKPLFGKKWDFEVKAVGNKENPFSYKIDMEKYRPYYESLILSLQKVGLIEPKVYLDAKKYLEKEEITIIKDFNVLLFAAIRNAFYENYENLKNGQINKIDTLAINGLLSKTKAEGLKTQLHDDKLFYRAEIFENSEKAVVLDNADLKTTDKEEVFNYLTSKIKSLIPELKIGNTTFQKTQISEPLKMKPGLADAITSQLEKFVDRNKIEVKIELDGRTYIKEIETVAIAENDLITGELLSFVNKILRVGWVNEKDLQIFNDYLIDKGSSERLFLIGDEISIFPKARFGKKVLIMMNQEQFKAVKKQFLLSNLGFGSGHDFEGETSIANLKPVLNTLQELGYITNIDKAEDVILEARKSKKMDLKNELIIGEFAKKPDFLVSGNINDEKPDLRTFLSKLSKTSGGKFSFTEYTDNFDLEYSKDSTVIKNLRYNYLVAGTKIEDSISIDSQNQSFGLFGVNPLVKLTNNAVEKINSTLTDEKFYEIKKANNETFYAFLKNQDVQIVNEKLGNYFNEIFREDEQAEIDSAATEVDNVSEFIETESFLPYLQENDLIENEEQFLQENEFGIRNGLKLLPFLKKRITLDLKDYVDKKPEDFLKDLYDGAKEKFLENSEYQFLTIKKDSVSIEESFEKIYKVKYGINGLIYEDKFSYLDIIFENIKNQKENNVPLDEMTYDYVSIPFSFVNTFLMDINSQARVFSEFDQISKINIGFIDGELAEMVNLEIEGRTSRDFLKNQIDGFVTNKLIKPISDDQKIDLINDYRQKYRDNSALMLLINCKSSSVIGSDDLFAKNGIKSCLENSINNKLAIQKYTDNFEVIKGISNQEMENEQPKEKLDVSGSYLYKNKKMSFTLPLSLENDYYIDILDAYNQIFKPLNPVLKTEKSAFQYYYSTEGLIFFINKEQKLYLEELEISFED